MEYKQYQCVLIILMFVTYNASSIKAQDNLYQFHAIFSQISPYIVTCTNSWLTSDIFDTEVNLDNPEYTMFRLDRGSRGGDVFILIKNQYIASRGQDWENDCEVLHNAYMPM